MTDESIIHHVTQTLPNNCVSACLAMVSRLNIDYITEVFHDDYVNCRCQIWEFLDGIKIPYTRLMADERAVVAGHVYLVDVPSLNIVAGLHLIVAEVVTDGWRIFDPNSGRKDRLSYMGCAPGVVPPYGYVAINAWVPLYSFKIEDLEMYYEQNSLV